MAARCSGWQREWRESGGAEVGEEEAGRKAESGNVGEIFCKKYWTGGKFFLPVCVLVLLRREEKSHYNPTLGFTGFCKAVQVFPGCLNPTRTSSADVDIKNQANQLSGAVSPRDCWVVGENPDWVRPNTTCIQGLIWEGGGVASPTDSQVRHMQKPVGL